MKKSFTLIELLIVVSIIVIFSGLLLASYNNFTERKRLEAQGEKIIDILELAKKKSVSRDLSPNLNCLEFEGYSVSFVSSSYDLIFHCGADEINVKNYDLDKNVTISAAEEVQFDPDLGVTGESSSLSIVLENSIIGRCVSITIYLSGVVEKGIIYDCP